MADADEGRDLAERAESSADAGVEEPANPEEAAEADGRTDPEGPPPGLITVRGAAIGVALLWLAAMAGIGALQASMYAYRVAPEYAVVAVAAAGLSLTAGYGSFSRFGLV